MKVQDLPYFRPDADKTEKLIKDCVFKIKNAKSTDDVMTAHDKAVDALAEFGTMGAFANMKYTLNSFDEYFTKEREYFDAKWPFITEAYKQMAQAMVESKFIDQLKERLNPIVFEKYRILIAASDPRIIEDKQKESEIVASYSKLMSEMNFPFDGKEMPLSILKGYLSNDDRAVRKAACEAIGRGLAAHRTELDDIYDKLVHVRNKMAKKLGYKDYVALGYLNMERYDYDREMVERFRESVRTDLVPVISDIKSRLSKKLGIDKYMFYDDSVCFVDGEPKPNITKDEIFICAQEMYNEMSPQIGAFMKSMIDTEAFDVDARKGKWGGGYCTSFEKYKQTFILANFNGSSDDIDVITHEFGHALAMNFALNGGDSELGIGGNETAECHSMSMEFFSWPYMDKFFGKDADKYRYKHLLSALSFIPYGTIVDEFQHIIYSNPDMTPTERNKAYLELEKKYRPYLSFEGIPYLEEGTRWQFQMHIYETPFYYIDYCLAQTVALNFLVESRKDYDDALDRYLDFCKAGGTIPFSKLCERAGIVSPFKKGALKKIADEIPKLLKEFD